MARSCPRVVHKKRGVIAVRIIVVRVEGDDDDEDATKLDGGKKEMGNGGNPWC